LDQDWRVHSYSL